MNHDHNEGGMGGKHGLIMLLCCLIPVVAIVAIRLFRVPLNSALFVGMLSTTAAMANDVAALVFVYFETDWATAAAHSSRQRPAVIRAFLAPNGIMI